MRISKHARQRMRQRGLYEDDVDLIFEYGTEVTDGFLLRRRDATSAIAALKRELTRLERLADTFVVVERNVVASIYHARPAKQKRLLRS